MSEPYLIGDAMTGGYGSGADILRGSNISKTTESSVSLMTYTQDSALLEDGPRSEFMAGKIVAKADLSLKSEKAVK